MANRKQTPEQQAQNYTPIQKRDRCEVCKNYRIHNYDTARYNTNKTCEVLVGASVTDLSICDLFERK